MKIYIRTSTDIYGMAVIDKNTFDIPYDIWLDPAGNARNVPHNTPRLKINVGKSKIPMSIEDEPRLLVNRKIINISPIEKFIKLNKDVLLQHWNKEISDKDVLNKLVKLKSNKKQIQDIQKESEQAQAVSKDTPNPTKNNSTNTEEIF